MSNPESPCLEAALESGVLVLTVVRRQIEGDEVARQLKEELLAATERHPTGRVVIDLKNTRYVSSIAFWPLLALRRQLQEMGGRLLICGLSEAVEDIFMTTKMVSTGGAFNAPFEMAADRAEAVARLAGVATAGEGPPAS
jgi:anti-anti-sigma factor